MLIHDSDSVSSKIWTRPVSAYELNAMLHIYVQTVKVNAAIDLYHTHSNIMDAYSISLLLQVLLASVTNTKSSLTTINRTNQTTPTISTTYTTQLSSERYHRTVESTSKLYHPELLPLRQTAVPSSGNTVWWQWNMAIDILDQAFATVTLNGNYTTTYTLWHSNPIWTMLLQLNEACGSHNDLYTSHNSIGTTTMFNDKTSSIQRHHDGSRIVQSILNIMQQRSIQPDTITSTLLLSSLHNYPSDRDLAVSLLRNASIIAAITGSTTTITNTNTMAL